MSSRKRFGWPQSPGRDASFILKSVVPLLHGRVEDECLITSHEIQSPATFSTKHKSSSDFSKSFDQRRPLTFSAHELGHIVSAAVTDDQDRFCQQVTWALFGHATEPILKPEPSFPTDNMSVCLENLALLLPDSTSVVAQLIDDFRRLIGTGLKSRIVNSLDFHEGQAIQRGVEVAEIDFVVSGLTGKLKLDFLIQNLVICSAHEAMNDLTFGCASNGLHHAFVLGEYFLAGIADRKRSQVICKAQTVVANRQRYVARTAWSKDGHVLEMKLACKSKFRRTEIPNQRRTTVIDGKRVVSDLRMEFTVGGDGFPERFGRQIVDEIFR